MLSFLVPFRSDRAERERNWVRVRDHLEHAVPGGEIVLGESPAGPFNPSAAVNDAAARAVGDIFCVHDADCMIDPDWYLMARAKVIHHGGWAIPEGSNYMRPDHGWDRVEFSVGGIVMLSRETFFAVRGKDERFEGWGPEDAAFVLALATLAAPRHRFGGPLTHLWHPTEGDGRPWPKGADRLFRRYERANGNPEAMRTVLAR